jgi:hypothetical protein
VKLARRFRELAGFDDAEIDEIAEMSAEARRQVDEHQQELASAARTDA